jgi:hypothetical protein
VIDERKEGAGEMGERKPLCETDDFTRKDVYHVNRFKERSSSLKMYCHVHKYSEMSFLLTLSNNAVINIGLTPFSRPVDLDLFRRAGAKKIYIASQMFGHTYSFNGFSLFLLLSTLNNNSEDIKTMK